LVFEGLRNEIWLIPRRGFGLNYEESFLLKALTLVLPVSLTHFDETHYFIVIS
jgi:hypothetical protein